MKKILLISGLILLATGCSKTSPKPADLTSSTSSTSSSSQTASSLPSQSDIDSAEVNNITLAPGTYPNVTNFQGVGLQIQSPWKDSTVVAKQTSTAIAIQNQEGAKFFIIKSPLDSSPLTWAMSRFQANTAQLKQIFGVRADSNYDFQDLIYNVTPARIASLPTNGQSVMSALLAQKELEVTQLPLYSFSTPTIHGFIMGNSAAKSRLVEFYTIDSDVEYTIGLENMTSSESDFVLSNIK
jgi:hypothetical protein